MGGTGRWVGRTTEVRRARDGHRRSYGGWCGEKGGEREQREARGEVRGEGAVGGTGRGYDGRAGRMTKARAGRGCGKEAQEEGRKRGCRVGTGDGREG